MRKDGDDVEVLQRASEELAMCGPKNEEFAGDAARASQEQMQ